SQLASLAGKLDPQNKGDSIFIRCPYHSGGHENTPSCRVNIRNSQYSVGGFYCYACEENGVWNKLAEATGLAGFKAADRVNDVFAFSINTNNQKKTRLEKWEKLKRWPK